MNVIAIIRPAIEHWMDGLNLIDNANRTGCTNGTLGGPSIMERTWSMASSVAKRPVQVIIDNLPEPDPGRRPDHTIGMGVKGKFVASDVAHTYCIGRALRRTARRRGVGEILQRIGGLSNMMDGPMFGEWRRASTFRTVGEAI